MIQNSDEKNKKSSVNGVFCAYGFEYLFSLCLLPILICRFNEISHREICRQKQSDSKFIWKGKRIRIGKIIPKNVNKVGGLKKISEIISIQINVTQWRVHK